MVVKKNSNTKRGDISRRERLREDPFDLQVSLHQCSGAYSLLKGLSMQAVGTNCLDASGGSHLEDDLPAEEERDGALTTHEALR